MTEKQRQLGMNPGTASYRLVKDLLFSYVEKSGEKCFQCKGDLTRDNFSVEHKIPWLHSENPVELFFDLNNIAYSHLSCNFKASRKRVSTAEHGTSAKYRNGCKCRDCKNAEASRVRARYTPEKRREKYAKEKLK